MSDYSGRYGDIWKFSESEYRAVEMRPNGAEVLHRRIRPEQLLKWMWKLQIPAAESARSHWRKHFPKTVGEIQKRFRQSEEGKLLKIEDEQDRIITRREQL